MDTPTTETAGIGHNHPSAHEALADRTEQLASIANAWLNTVKEIKDEEQAKKADDLMARVKAEIKDVEAARKTEKQPHMEAAKGVDELYKPLANKLEKIKSLFSPLITRYLQEQDRKRREEQRRQEEEALEKMRIAQEAEEAAKAAQAGAPGADVIGATMEAEEAAKAAEAAIKSADKIRTSTVGIKGNYSERATALRTVWHAEIANYDKAFDHFRDHPQVRDLIQSLADQAARSAEKKPIPGVEFKSEQKAA